MVKTIFKDKAGNKLVRLKSGAISVKNKKGKNVSLPEFKRFIKRKKVKAAVRKKIGKNIVFFKK